MTQRAYHHLDINERRNIYYWRHYKGLSIREMARRLGRSHTTVSRELKRNIGCWGDQYYHNPAQGMADRRRANRPKPPALKSIKTQVFVENRLRAGWTPEIIAGRLTLIDDIPTVSHEAIYQYIYKDRKELIEFLPRKHKRRRKKHPYRSKSRKQLDKTMICDRPEHIDNRIELGHWESDSMESVNHEAGLNVLIERTTRLIHISRLKDKTSKATAHAVVKRLRVHPKEFCKSITYDNGPENWSYKEVESALESNSYFCEPYSSWQKGSVEQSIGLIRRYLPKKTDIGEVPDKILIKIEKLLNNRPRKCLGYKTPYEMISQLRSEGGALEF